MRRSRSWRSRSKIRQPDLRMKIEIKKILRLRGFSKFRGARCSASSTVLCETKCRADRRLDGWLEKLDNLRTNSRIIGNLERCPRG